MADQPTSPYPPPPPPPPPSSPGPGPDGQPVPAYPPAPSPLPPEFQTAGATVDQRNWGMIAHLAALAGLVFPLFGTMIGPLIVWLIKKDESRFVAFHAVQTMFFQMAIFVILLPIVSVAGVLLTYLPCVSIIPLSLAGAIYLGAMAYSLVGGLQINAGKDFEYYFIGEKVRSWGK
jgi:uncharacterized protein